MASSPDAAGREIGPIGTASRTLAGAAAITVPVAIEGIGWWDLPGLAAALVVVTTAARLITPVIERTHPETGGARHKVCSPAGCLLIGVLFAAASALGAATPAHADIAFWGFLGTSMLLAAARGDGGCELLALPNAITGREDRIGCILFTPIDAAEARRRAVPHPWTGPRTRQAAR